MGFERLPPDFVPLQVEAEDPDIAEVAVEMCSIGDRCFRSETVFQVNCALWAALMDLPIPDDVTGLQIEAQHLPLMYGIGWCWTVSTKIESLLRLFGRTGV